ncbi:MAG TPA: MoaD/ThiS family protein [Caulobacteraceae bacterium]|nr:MoaD/ThiS family protein [Caulobacteraceae bacterium]
MISVLIPSQLHAYSGGQSRVEAAGRTVDAVLDDLDRRFPGLKFRVVDEQARIRPHMRVYVGQDAARDVTTAVEDGAELMIFGALSGG